MAKFDLPSLAAELKQALNVPELPSRIAAALRMAFDAHANQWRDNVDEAAAPIPYIVHPVGVAKLAVEFFPSAKLPDSLETVVCVCLLHDAIEDSGISISQIEEVTSRRVAVLCVALTKPQVRQGQHRDQRNVAFVQQIKEAGATARFVKTCDILHNLSRPRQMPVHLLQKTIAKAASYGDLTNDESLGDRLPAAFSERVIAAKAFQESGAGPKAGGAGGEHRPDTLDAALAYVAARTNMKVLERHDVCAVLEDAFGAQQVLVGDNAYLSDHLARKLGLEEGTRAQLAAAIKKGAVIDVREIFPPAARQAAKIILVDAHSGVDAERAAFCFERLPAAWISEAGLQAAASFAFEKLRLQHVKDAAGIVERLSLLGLDVPQSLALQSGFDFHQFQSLKARLDAAAFVHRNLMAAILQHVEQSGMSGALDRIEGRVKTAASVLKKLGSRKLSDVADIDDLVGIRLIVSSRKARQQIVTEIQQGLTSETSDLGRSAMPLAESVMQQQIESAGGYKAVHIRFLAASPTMRFSAIACEIQVRTIFEDAWARLSQLQLYKRRGTAKTSERALVELRQLCDSCDDVIDKV